MGGTIVKASLIGTCFCKRPLVFTFPGASGNCRDLQPIITKGHPPTGEMWECLMSCLSMAADGVDFGCCVRSVESPVRCDVITFIFSTNNYIW